MRFEFIVDEHVKVKTFLKKHEVSKGLLAKIKFRGGQILVNGRPENAIYLLDIGDHLVIDIPAEDGFETLKPMDRPLDILFEDGGKRTGVSWRDFCIGSIAHPTISGGNVSQNELVLRFYLESLGFVRIPQRSKRSDRVGLEGKELDLYNDKLKIAIEYGQDHRPGISVLCTGAGAFRPRRGRGWGRDIVLCGAVQNQEGPEVSQGYGIRLRPLECIILTVNNDFMDAGGYAHEQLQ